MPEFSDQDLRLLRELQRDASASLADLGARVGMAASTVWRRVEAFEKAGLVRARVTLLDPGAAGVKLCIFAQVSLADHSEETVAAFARVIRSHPEIMEAHAVSGTADYILKIRCPDVEAYETFRTHTLLRSSHVRGVVSAFSLKELKYTTELPL